MFKNIFSVISLETFSRLSIALLYFWFGILKLLNKSPATTIIQNLHERLIPFIDFQFFFIFFSLLEVLIGIIILVKPLTKLAIAFSVFHIFTTMLPLVFIKEVWNENFLQPTLEGQYIIKNVVIIALLLNIYKQWQQNFKKNLKD